MSASMSHKIQAQSSSLRMHEETKPMQKQGIVSILGSENERTKATATSLRLRRTLSADMSSKKWLSQNGFTPMKRTSSSEDFSPSKTIPHSFCSSDEEDEEEGKKEQGSERGQFNIWSSIQRDKKKDQEQACRFDIWSCILSNKSNEESSKSVPLPPPYIHPLVKRSQSSLSEKSLEICTESLGSETGSDVLSSYPSSETDEEEHEQEQKVTVEAYEAEKEEEEYQVPKYNYSTTASTKKSSPRSFPPPLPSLSRQHGPWLHVRSRRDDGRLVLEAVSLPSNNYFCAQREDGRLVLTFTNHQHSKEEEEEEDAQVMDEAEKAEMEEDSEAEDETEEEESEAVNVLEQARIVPSGITSLALMMNKPIGLVNSNSNPNWSEKLNEVVNLEDVNAVNRPRVARLISSAPAMASAASFNVYEYYWRTKPTGTAKGSPLTLQQGYNSCSLNNNSSSSSKLIVSGDMNPQLVVLRGKNGGYLVHNLKSCKESRRSFLFWEPYCIATS